MAVCQLPSVFLQLVSVVPDTSPTAGSARTPGQNRSRRGLWLGLVSRLLPIGITSDIANALNYFPALFRSERIGLKFHRAGTAAATGMGRAPTGPPQRVSEIRFSAPECGPPC